MSADVGGAASHRRVSTRLLRWRSSLPLPLEADGSDADASRRGSRGFREPPGRGACGPRDVPGEVRAELGAFRTGSRGATAMLRAEVRKDIGDVRRELGELRSDVTQI